MNNGVEVIVAINRRTKPSGTEYLRLLSSNVTRPLTLAPHTLTNLMSMVLSSEQVTEDSVRLMSLLQPTFTTKTYYTAYNYIMTTLKDNTTALTNAKVAVTNFKTEPISSRAENSKQDVAPTKTLSFRDSPILRTEVFNTEYTYLNTYLDGDQPLIASSTLTVSNTFIGTHGDTFNCLEPSEVLPTANTYLKTVELKKTLTDGTDRRVVSTSDVVTQVVVTDKPTRKPTGIPLSTNVTKTYFVTYTYFSTYVEGDKTRVKSDVSVSSDVTIEKFYIKPKKTDSKSYERTETPVKVSVTFPFNIVVTKTYQTTFTYFTTLFQGSNSEKTESRVDSKTKIVENAVAETISQQDFNTDYLVELNSSLQKISGSVVATATLKKGEIVVITAYKNPSIKDFYQKYEIKPTKTVSRFELKTKFSEIEGNFSEMEGSGEEQTSSETTSRITLIKPSKTVVREPVAEALVAPEKDDLKPMATPILTAMPSSFSSSVGQEAQSSSVTPHLAEQEYAADVEENKIKEKPEESISTSHPPSQPPKKKQEPKEPIASTNVTSLLNSFNGVNVLAPVFNAMAELIKINKNSDSTSRRNDTVGNNDPEQIVRHPSSGNDNPILNFVKKFTSAAPVKSTSEPKTKPTSPKTPVYIPVGSFGQDSVEVADNQNRRVLVTNGADNWYEKWQNIHAKNFEKIRPYDNNPINILEGGIPISPGQVITTNSDVIIGRPGESGPRPPNFALKNNIPVDMKPPPRPPSNAFTSVDEDHFVAQYSNKKVNFQHHEGETNFKLGLPPSPPKKNIQKGQNYKFSRPHLNDRYKGGLPSQKNTHLGLNTNTEYDSGSADLNPPPEPPQPIQIRDSNLVHDPNRPIAVNHRPKQEPSQNFIGATVQSGESQNLENYINPAVINPSNFELPTVPLLPIHPGSVLNAPTPNLDAANLQSILLLPIEGSLGPAVVPNLVDRSTGHPFLVNIQPSQVANVVIPHGSSTAMFVNEDKHSMKGEVIDDPSPHPEPETVGFVGSEPVLKIENEDIAAGSQNELVSSETEEAPNTNGGRPFGQLPSLNRPQPNADRFRISTKHFGEQNGHFHAGQNSKFNHQSSDFHRNASIFHHSFGNKHRIENQLSHHLQGQSSGILLSDNKNFNALNSVKGVADGEYLKTYRKETNPKTDALNFNGNLGPLNFKNIFDGTYYKQGEGNQNRNPPGLGDPYADQIRFKQGPSSQHDGENGDSGRPNVNQFQEGRPSTKQQFVSKEKLINQQLGIVRPNSGHKKEKNPLKDILINENSNRNEQESSLGPQYFESQNSKQRTPNDFSADLSPPPLPHRPTHQSSSSPPSQKIPQRYRPSSHHQTVRKPLDFMIPPPEIPNRLKVKPQTEFHSRPAIPIGADVGPLQNFVHPRPEDTAVVQHRPIHSELGFPNQNLNLKRPGGLAVLNGFYDLAVSDTSGPVKTESEEQSEEVPGSQIFYPGQGDLIQFNRNFSDQFSNHQKPLKSIGSVEVTKNHAFNENVRIPINPVATAINTNLYQDLSVKVKLQGAGNNAGQYGYVNHGGTSKVPNRKDQSSSFESFGLKGTVETDSSKTGSSNVPSAFVPFRNVTSNGKVRVPGVRPHSQASGFVKNENSVIRRPPSNVAATHGSNFTREHSTNHVASSHDNTKFLKETLSNEAFFGWKGETTNQSDKKQKPSSEKKGDENMGNETSGSHGQTPSLGGHKKKPGRYGSPNRPYVPNLQSNRISQNYSRPSSEAVGSKITGSIQNTAATKNNRNKIQVGYPTITNVPVENSGANGQRKPFHPADSFGQENPQIKHSSGPTGSKDQEDANKISSGTRNEDKTSLGNIDLKNGSNYTEASVLISRNDTSADKNSSQNQRNKTLNFYESKPASDVAEVINNYDEGDKVDKWFIANFNNNNNKKNNVHHRQNDSKLTTEANESTSYIRNQQNTSLITTSAESDIPSNLLTPPKVAESEEVLGLSPPPLNRRKPQGRPQRPKPAYAFEIPNLPKATTSAPVGMENAFPHDRSPEFNRKPFKPQDIFPPRLPQDFVHHLPQYPKQKHPHKPVTSLAIDIPATGTTEKPPQLYVTGTDYEDNYDDEPFFAESEINGHSKPISGDDALPMTERPVPPVFDGSNSKSFTPTKSKETSRPQSMRTEQSQESIMSSSKRQETSAAIDVSPTETYSTQVSDTAVIPTDAEPYGGWRESDIISGSETAIEPNQFSSNVVTPAIDSVTDKKGQVITTLVSSGSTTIFSNMFTQVPNGEWINESELPLDFEEMEENVGMTDEPIIRPTETTTLTVTSTTTTVVHSVGHKPSTKTIVLTKTLISTVFNKITETKTLLKPTTATLIQTQTVATTKTALPVPTALYPSQTKYQAGGTLKPEIFIADPHAKDTISISVSSSLNNNNRKKVEQKGRPAGTEPVDQLASEGSVIMVLSNDHESEGEIDSEENEIDQSGLRVSEVFDSNVDKTSNESNNEEECFPACQATRNEGCQRIKGVMKCVCRPGFARMFPDTPCRPTYTYKIKLGLDKLGPEQLNYKKDLAQSNPANMAKLTSVTKEGLDRMIMQSELRDIYQGVVVNGFQGKRERTMVDFYVQLSENTDEKKLMEIFMQTLQNSNYSLGGTELFAAREADNLDAEDFNECLNPKFHDCSEHARCFNLKGTYTCSCQEGYADMSENSLFPGRICSDAIGCEYCGYHGVCYSKGEDEITCKCFQWYSGDRCNINLKVLLIALVTIGAILLALLLVCAVLTCLNKKRRNTSSARSNGYLRYRGHSMHSIDRRAMISDSSSESSLDNLPCLTPLPLAPTAGTMSTKKKAVLKHVKGPVPRALPPPGMEQRSRSVTVMIPRAKYRPPPHLSPHLTMSTFSPEKHLPKPPGQIAAEQKLISYLDGNTREDRSIITSNNKNHGHKQETEHHNHGHQQQQQQQQQHKSYEKSSSLAILGESSDRKKESRIFEYEYKISNMTFSEETSSAERRLRKLAADDRLRRHSDSTKMQGDSNRMIQFRKYSAGALVSAGYEVSAKVGMHQLEDEATEDDQSGILNTHTMKSNLSQFTTLNRTGDHKTMSEARSYDETTVHPQTRSLKTDYSGSSPSSRANNDEGHTMIERDLGSTFIMPESQLFKPEADRGSDISNFDSL